VCGFDTLQQIPTSCDVTTSTWDIRNEKFQISENLLYIHEIVRHICDDNALTNLSLALQVFRGALIVRKDTLKSS